MSARVFINRDRMGLVCGQFSVRIKTAVVGTSHSRMVSGRRNRLLRFGSDGGRGGAAIAATAAAA